MAWRIASWSAESGKGTICSPHIGPLTFGEVENDWQITDYRVGEEVNVEVEGPTSALRVTRIRPMRPRNPPGTEAPELSELNAAMTDELLDHDYDVANRIFRLIFGFCCAWCSTPVRATFSGVRFHEEFTGELSFGEPHFRRASPEEAYAWLPLSPSETAYAMVVRDEDDTLRSIVVIAEGITIDYPYTATDRRPH